MRIHHLLTRCGRSAICGLAGWLCACPLSGWAAVTNVSIIDFAFSPPDVIINVNDQVLWTWNGSFSHSSTSGVAPTPDGLWDSGLHGNGFTFSVPFPNSGSYPYYCSLHFFTGSVTVQSVAVPPSAAITSPTNGTTVAAPWTGTIQATASESGGTISKVDFYAGTTLLGTVTNPSPTLSLGVTNLAAGSYALTAVATDGTGDTNTPVAVNLSVVTPVAIVLSAPQRVSASSFQFSYSANPGLTYIVLRASGLTGLLPISTNQASSNPATFLDTNATGDLNFYGVHLAPNP